MSIGVGNSDVASLTGQVRLLKQQLDDWATCVSAKTTKGQAEIQRLSGEVSATQQQLDRLSSQPSQSTQPTPVTESASHSIDVWA